MKKNITNERIDYFSIIIINGHIKLINKYHWIQNKNTYYTTSQRAKEKVIAYERSSYQYKNFQQWSHKIEKIPLDSE